MVNISYKYDFEHTTTNGTDFDYITLPPDSEIVGLIVRISFEYLAVNKFAGTVLRVGTTSSFGFGNMITAVELECWSLAGFVDKVIYKPVPNFRLPDGKCSIISKSEQAATTYYHNGSVFYEVKNTKT